MATKRVTACDRCGTFDPADLVTHWHISGPAKFGIDLCAPCAEPLVKLSQIASGTTKRRPSQPVNIEEIPLDNVY